MTNLQFRKGTPADHRAIAALHARSWQETYRGILTDDYLDGNLVQERESHWLPKLMSLSEREFVILAESDCALVGFVCVLDKPERGFDAFIDNLHVRKSCKGNGIGTSLLKAVSRELHATGRKSFYLWVLDGNDAAAGFYAGKGGLAMDKSTVIFGGRTVGHQRFGFASPDQSPC